MSPTASRRRTDIYGLRPNCSVPISDCVVFEDSVAGVAAGRAAGAAHVVGVGEGALATDADLVVRDLREIRWDGRTLDIAAGSRLR